MRVDAGYSYANTFTSKPTESSASADFSRVMQEAKSANKTEQVGTVDQASKPVSSAPNFRSMTNADLLSWVNNELDQGRISLDDSMGFISMIAISPELTGAARDFAVNQEKHDFVARAQRGMEYAESTHNPVSAESFETALNIMRGSQPSHRIFETG